MSVKYTQHVPAVFGAGAIQELGEHAKRLGGSKVMLVYTADLTGSVLVDRAHKALEAAGLPYLDFNKMLADPPSDLVDEGGELARKEKVDCLVGIGGGSSMDASKAIAVLLSNPGSILNYMQDPPLAIDLKVPVIMVPTTAGTGSEVSTVAIVTNTQNHTKPALAIHGALALIDPELTATMPPSVTANTGMDVLCHSMESSTGKESPNPLSTVCAMDAIRRVFRSLPTAVADGSNMDARTDMAIAANFAGIAISNNHCHLGHAVAYALSAAFHTPHGLNCIWGEAEVFRLVAPVVPNEMHMIAEAMGLDIAADADIAAVADAVADAIYDLMRACKVPSMKERGFTREQATAPAVVDHIMANFLTTRCPMDIKTEMVQDLLGKVYDNYQ